MKPSAYRHRYTRVIEDKRLRWSARCLLVYLLSRPTDWKVISAHLVKQGELGRHRILSLLKELREHRYLDCVRRRDKRGRIAGGSIPGTWVTVHSGDMGRYALRGRSSSPLRRLTGSNRTPTCDSCSPSCPGWIASTRSRRWSPESSPRINCAPLEQPCGLLGAYRSSTPESGYGDRTPAEAHQGAGAAGERVSHRISRLPGRQRSGFGPGKQSLRADCTQVVRRSVVTQSVIGVSGIDAGYVVDPEPTAQLRLLTRAQGSRCRMPSRHPDPRVSQGTPQARSPKSFRLTPVRSICACTK